jgi:hypothetical protein
VQKDILDVAARNEVLGFQMNQLDAKTQATRSESQNQLRRGDAVPHEPEAQCDCEPETYHDTHRVCTVPRSLSRGKRSAIINGITNDSRNEGKIEFVDKKTSHRRNNEASEIRAVRQEHRADLGLANPAEKISYLEKDTERYYYLILRYFEYLDRELERNAKMKLSEEKMKSGRDGRLS